MAPSLTKRKKCMKGTMTSVKVTSRKERWTQILLWEIGDLIWWWIGIARNNNFKNYNNYGNIRIGYDDQGSNDDDDEDDKNQNSYDHENIKKKVLEG